MLAFVRTVSLTLATSWTLLCVVHTAAAQTPTAPQAQPGGPSQPAAPAAPSIRVGCVNLSYIAANSKQGKVAFAELASLTKKKETELAVQAKALEAVQDKLQADSNVLDAQARAVREQMFQKARLEFDRFRQDTQTELQQFAERVEKELQAKLFPVVDQVSRERGLHLVFDVGSPGLLWFDTTIDLSAEVVKRLDAAP